MMKHLLLKHYVLLGSMMLISLFIIYLTFGSLEGPYIFI